MLETINKGEFSFGLVFHSILRFFIVKTTLCTLELKKTENLVNGN